MVSSFKDIDPEKFHGFISALRAALEPPLFEAICDSIMSISEADLNAWDDEEEVIVIRLLRKELLQ